MKKRPKRRFARRSDPVFWYDDQWEDRWLDEHYYRAPAAVSWYAEGPFPNDWAWVTNQLATGGMPLSTAEVTNLVRAGITHVVNCSDEYVLTAERVLEPDDRIRYLFNPTPDNGSWKSKEWFERTIDFVKPALENGDRALVHCLCGSNRGPSSAYAVLRAMGTPKDEAEDLIRTARPRASLRYLPDAEDAVRNLLTA